MAVLFLYLVRTAFCRYNTSIVRAVGKPPLRWKQTKRKIEEVSQKGFRDFDFLIFGFP